ncbi:MAG TPA: PKD domain-containing protein [Thermoanaerobaculia bacterium]|nr:PKD domain-containing protein [Thermoanaerobaculia bacterium]
MNTSRRLRTDRAPFLLLVLSLCLAGLLTGAEAGFAQTCSEGSPAKIAGQPLWGSLRPGDVFEGNARNDIRDSTDYTGNNLPGAGNPLYLSVDIENGWVLTSYASGIRAWDTSTSPEKPGDAGMLDIRTTGCTSSNAWPETPFCTELKHYFWDIDAPAGNDEIVAMIGIKPVGLSILNTKNKNSMKVQYQDIGKGSTPAGSQVYAATLGGRSYAFGVFNQGQSGIFLYDMKAADDNNSKCKENTDTEAGRCPGVFKGRIGNGTPAIYIDGVGTASGKHYIVASSQSFSVAEKGIEIWNVTNPLAPANVHSSGSGGRFLTNQFTGGVAMWEQGGQQYLATHVDGGAQIFDVTSCLANGCSSLGNPIWSGSWTTYGRAPQGADRLYVTFSRSGSKPMLYFGSNDQCNGGRQREFLFDASNASSPVEITPDGIMDIAGKTIDYWGWYYAGNNPATGFSRVMPMVAKFSGNVLYRAAQTVFDTHVWTNAAPTPPNANFSWLPTTVYANQPVIFTDTSTGTVTSRLWTFPTGTTVLPGNTASPVTVTFDSEGTKPVSLRAENAAGPDTETRNVEVLDPKPKFGSIGRTPQDPQTCQKVTFTPTVTGFPAPGVTWVVKDGNGNKVYPLVGELPPFELPGNSLLAGAYTAVFTATNTAGSVTADPHAFNIANPPALSVSTPVCTNCTSGSPEFGTVNLSATATGATGYSWDFGDGSGFRTDAQYNTATPAFSYGSVGQKAIRVKVLGCAGEQISQTLTVEIKNVNPLKINKFEAICAFAPCGFDTNTQINFEVNVSGDPTGYEFDWDGNGSFEDTTSRPDAQGLVKHSYSTAKTYKPVMKIVRGAESLTSPEHFPIVVSNGGGGGGGGNDNPSISISGPTTGQPNAALTFTASASNCTPAATWNWNGAGGTVTGTGNSVTILWASTGAKQISVTNSGCSGASDSHTVAINEPGGGGGGGGGGLTANFSWTPAAPNAGQVVTFDAGTSTGSPTVYTWDFGGALKSGKTVTHTFAASGAFTVKLEIAKSGDCAFGLCTASTSKQVTVGGGAPPLIASFNTSATCVAEFGPAICTVEAGQAVTFTSTSTGDPTSWAWAFGDGGTANTAAASHTFQQSGSFTVTLTVGKGANTSAISRTFVVTPGSGEPPLGASFQTSAACTGNTCTAQAGQAVTFTSTSTGSPASQSWSFGDGGNGNGASVTHTFQAAGTFTVTLTIGKGANNASTSKTFNVSPAPVVQPEASTIVLPWVAQSRGVLQQTSNLYIHNPGTTAMEVVLEFRRQGTPEANPPRAALTIQPGATQYVVDVLKGLFKVENTVGFVTITKTKGDRNPVMTSFNNVAGKKGSQYGQTIPGVALSREGTAAATTGSRVQYLVGLNDNSDRQAYFGITNPNAEPAVYRLKFVDSLGRPIGNPSGDLTLPSFGARQYQLSEIRSQFGITTEDDYRVEVETVSGKQLYPYGTNVQTVSKDPSYQGAGQSKDKLYLLGAMRTKGLNKSEWQSDIVLSNTGTEVALADVSFLNAGPSSQPTAPLKITLQAGQTDRLENVGKSWNVKDSVGLLTIESDAPGGLFPVVQGESYLSTQGKPGARYGLAMAAFTDEDAAGPGHAHYLVGLRHDANNRSTLWVYNNSNEAANYDLIYRGLDGKVLGRIDNVVVGAGKLRQFNPSQHPLKAIGKKGGGVAGGFTIEVVVKSGKVLAAAQVVNNKTNDPAYVQGQAQ